jgi:Helicase HerA-like C-terminal
MVLTLAGGSDKTAGASSCRWRSEDHLAGSVAGGDRAWYARIVTAISLFGDEAGGPWVRVLSIPEPWGASSAERDFLAILPAAASAARQRRPFAVGWLCRGPGCPLELITNAVIPVTRQPHQPMHLRLPGFPGGQVAAPIEHPGFPAGQGSTAEWPGSLRGEVGPPGGEAGPLGGGPGLPTGQVGSLGGGPGLPGGQVGPLGGGPGLPGGQVGSPGGEPGFPGGRVGSPGGEPRFPGESPGPVPPALLFPAGSRGVPPSPGWLAAWEALVWAPCLGRQAPPLITGPTPAAMDEAHQPTRFEAALTALMHAPFGWLVVAWPIESLEEELAELRSQVNVLRLHDEERARYGAQRAERRLAELDTFREGGLWEVRVLAGAATETDLALLAPVLAGSAELARHPYRLESSRPAHPLSAALRLTMEDPRSDARVPFTATAGVLAALAGLPRREVPGLRVLSAGDFDLTSETAGPAFPTTGVGPGPSASPARSTILPEPTDRPGSAHRNEPAAPGQQATSGQQVVPGQQATSGQQVPGRHGTSGKHAARSGPAHHGSAAPPGLPGGCLPAGGSLPAGPTRPGGYPGPGAPSVTSISLGSIVDDHDRPVGEFTVPLATVNRHAFVAGATGAGKSQTVRHLLEQLAAAGLPWLAIEPVKTEYAGMAGRLQHAEPDARPTPVTVINPADPGSIPISVNPLAPEPGYPVQAHIDMVRALFLAAFDADEPFPQIISQALQRVYEANGWDVVTGGRLPGAQAEPLIPTLAQLQRAALEVVADVGYGKELQADVRGFVDVRLRSLRIGSAGRFFEGGHPADIGDLLARNVVLAIEDIANDEDKAFLMGTLIIRIVEHLRLRARTPQPPDGPAAQLPDGPAARLPDGPASRRLDRAAPQPQDRGPSQPHGGSPSQPHGGSPSQPHGGGPSQPRGRGPSQPPGLRHVIVIEEAHRLLRTRSEGRASAHAVELFASLLAEIRAYGEGLVIAEQIPAKLLPDVVKNTALKVIHRLPAADDRELVGATMNLSGPQSRQVVSLEPGVAAVFADGMDRPVRVRVPFGGDREHTVPGPAPPILGRRSPACGPHCHSQRACTGQEMRRAELLAAPAAADDAWLRVWAETVVLAFLTNHGLPSVPEQVRKRWDGLRPRLRECLLATLVDRAVTKREQALAASYDPARLAASVARAALGALGRPSQWGTRPGPAWVIPQLRWLHEMERVWPGQGTPPDSRECAPPLDFDLPGLADWPGMRVGHRLRALRRHHLTMELARNRLVAWTALLGEDDHQSFGQDLATTGVGLGRAAWLHQVAAATGTATWLETVLAWPRRFIAPAAHPDGTPAPLAAHPDGTPVPPAAHPPRHTSPPGTTPDRTRTTPGRTGTA